MPCNNTMLTTIPTLYAGYTISVRRMVIMENRRDDPGNIQGSHDLYPSWGLNIEHARTAFRKICETEY